jgi:5-methylcytosine-specific restriction endonuclease McrA
LFAWLRQRTEDLFGRSGSWARVRREHLEQEPSCAACGRSRELEVHHVVPYHERPELELDPTNLITLCADPCHIVHGHLMNWKKSNPDVREDAMRYSEKVRRA